MMLRRMDAHGAAISDVAETLAIDLSRERPTAPENRRVLLWVAP
jgi:hypothetical protein